jgi:hypothetical protein
MIHLANICLFTLLFVNLMGLALVTGFWLRNAWLALTAGPWLFCSLGFFIESFHGLGNLTWVWPFTTAISIGLLLEVTGRTCFLVRWDKWLKLDEWKSRLSPLLVPAPYIMLVVLFGYVMLWRYVFPNIDESSEKIADLAYVCGYYSGDTLPVRDVWFYPFLSTSYYSFQYYAAALMGRILGIEPGAAYNIAFCALIGLAFTAGVGSVCQATSRLWIRVLVSAGWIFGGSGVTIIIHFLAKDPPVWDNFRFIGSAILDKEPWGTFLTQYQNKLIPPGATVPMDLPGEQLSYSTYLGDYHPPLAGFYLLALGLLVLNLWANGASNWVLFIAGACLPWCAVADTWNLPLEVLGLGAWGLYHFKKLQAGGWRYLLGGAIAAMVVVYPYFLIFAYSVESYHTGLELVPWGYHTPILMWLLFLFPTFGLTILGISSRNNLVWSLGILWLGFLIFSEFFYVHDIYSGPFIRFNTTLKWWPWIAAATLLTLGPRLLERSPDNKVWIIDLGQKFSRIAAFFLIAYPLCYAYDLGRAWTFLPRDHMGQLNGSAFYGPNGEKPLLDYLKLMPKGMVAEHPENDFTANDAMTLFSGKPCYLGWLGHEQLWRGYLPELTYRREQVESFYAGNMVNAGEWMRSQDIAYILWFKKIDLDPLWDKANASLGNDYYWHEFYRDGTRRVGLWERKKSG